MNILLVFASPNGTTKGVAGALRQHLTGHGHTVTWFDIGEGDHRDMPRISPAMFAGADVVGIGFPVYHLTMPKPMAQFWECVLPAARASNPNLRAFVFVTYAGITTGMALRNAVRDLRRLGIPFTGAFKVKAPHFLHTAGYPDAAAQQTVRQFCELLTREMFSPLPWPRAQSLFRHPKLIVRLIYPFARIFQKLREQPIAILPDRCVACGACAKACICQAIRMQGKAVRDPGRCIHCYRCAAICPAQAVQCDTRRVYAMVAQNRRIVGEEQPPNAVYR